MFTGNRIKLTAISERHAEYFFQMFNNMEIQRNADLIKNPTSIEQVIKVIEENQESKRFEFWFVIEDLEGNIVGDIDINDPDMRNGTFKYGISILPEYRRKGYSKEAIIMVLDFYFNELRFNKVNAEIHSFNNASIVLNESIGLKREGEIREAIYVNGEYYSEYIYGMTKKEYNERYKKIKYI